MSYAEDEADVPSLRPCSHAGDDWDAMLAGLRVRSRKLVSDSWDQIFLMAGVLEIQGEITYGKLKSLLSA